MKGLVPLFLGVFGTFAFSWVGLTVIPNYQIGHLDPQMDEEGTDIYPAPKSGMADRGRSVYTGNGCFYCHSQQVRPDYLASDIDRKWGERRSAPRDYVFERPALLGKMRMGPDLSNIGKRAPAEDQSAPAASASPTTALSPAAKPAASPARSTSSPAASPAQNSSPVAGAPNASPAANVPAASAPPAQRASPAASATPAGSPASAPKDEDTYSAAWHHKHLYSPRSVSPDSNMPAYRFLYEKRRISGEPAADALKLTSRDAPSKGWEIVPTYDAKCLVAYLMSLDQSHPLKEVKSAAPAALSAASPAAAAGSPAPPPK
jgi:cbb3-type cytochrome oxidase cytochrome c subunit